MAWSSALRKPSTTVQPTPFSRPSFEESKIDWKQLVTIDFETYYDAQYTLRKMSTSEYVRDPRFKAHMVGIKIGTRKTKVVPTAQIKTVLKSIDWKTHDLLCHHTQFDGFILSQHYGVVPRRYYDTLSMARALHSNDIGAGLDEVAQFYGKGNKIAGVVDQMKGVLDLPKELYQDAAVYCANDVDLCLEIFKEMVPQMPKPEMDLVHHTVAMFCDPVLLVDVPRVEKELQRELQEKEVLLLSTIGTPKQIERRLKGATVDELKEEARKKIASNEGFAELLRAEGIDPPKKVSPAYFKHRDESRKYAYAFAKTDLEFTALLEHPKKRIRDLVETRLSVKSTIGETRAERFLEAGKNGTRLPVYLRFYGAHTGRWCMKPETEVLTPNGWVMMKSWDGQDIMQWAPDRSLSWTTPAMNSFDFVGEMIRTNSIHVCGAYTPEHTIPAWTTGHAFKTHTAEGAFGKNIRVPINGIYCGERRLSLTAAEIRLLVAVQADGNIEDSTNRPIRFKFRKIRKMERLRWICKDAGVPLDEYATLPERTFSISRKHVPQWLWGAKTFSSELLKFTAEQRDVFLSELRYWDGSVNSDYVHYTTCCKGNAEMVATLAALDGKAANVNTGVREAPQSTKYTVTIRERSYAHITSKNWGAEPYAGKVYCPTTETGFFLVRSEGKIFVTGNSAGNKMNMQNLPRGGELRRSILAPKGHVLVVADSGQIEARVNAWISEQDDLLQDFADQKEGDTVDVYTKFASTVYGHEVTKDDKEQRFVGKVGILGLGYSMGAPKLQSTLAVGAMGPAVFFDIGMCQKIVQAYRRKNNKIVQFWGLCGRIIEDMAAGRTGTYKCLSWEKERLWLPNGMALKYPGLKKVSNGQYEEWTYLRKGIPTRIYGGLLCENIVQSLARIIVGDQLLAVAAKYRVATTTHDELVALARIAGGERAYKFMHKCMSTPPAWCADLPLSCEGGFDVNYSK